MTDFEKQERALRNNKFIRDLHERICGILRGKNAIFSELVDLVRAQDILFVPHFSIIPGMRWWAVPIELKADEMGRLTILHVYKVIHVPYEDILIRTEDDIRQIFLQEIELSHELGHIAVFQTEDLKDWLECPFLRLSPKRVCPYLELRAFEEGIKILGNIMDKYDPEIKTKRKLEKFLRIIYLSGEYSVSFSSQCAIEMKIDDLELENESELCPVMARFRETIARLKVGALIPSDTPSKTNQPSDYIHTQDP